MSLTTFFEQAVSSDPVDNHEVDLRERGDLTVFAGWQGAACPSVRGDPRC